ncbi:MAG: methyltransferase [Planctomycetota bacterium]
MATTLAPPQDLAQVDEPTVAVSSPEPTLATAETHPRSNWARLCGEFLKCHRRPLNVALHLLTTPAALFGVNALIWEVHPIALITFIGLQAILVTALTPTSVALIHGAVVTAIAALAAWTSPGIMIGIVALVGGYFGQDLAHWIAGEKTFQSTYIRKRGWLAQFIEHTVLLLPVILVIAGRWKESPFRILVQRKAILKTKLTGKRHREDFGSICAWVKDKQPVVTQSNHWWQADLTEEAGEAFARLSHDDQLLRMIRNFHGPGYEVKPVLGMNELYVTGPPKKSTSDTVFYMGHVDGPWSVFPGARLYRCMLALNENLEVTTHYPMSKTDYGDPEGHRLEHGDAVAFDFNRELHYITREPNEAQAEPRLNLKLHFVAYPKSISWYGRLLDHLTTSYDIKARNLFLATIDPNSIWTKVKAKWVLFWTKTFELAVRHVGWTNLTYVAFAALLSLVFWDSRLFLVATSFVHYLIYVGTFQERTPVSFGTFRRDAVLFKSLAMIQLFAVFGIGLFAGDMATTAIAGTVALVAAGFGLATYATAVLGLDRTYFSWELGFASPKRIARFPFGVIPHPMIVGAMIGIAGMLLVPAIRDNFAWLIAGHLIGYLIVLLHEIVTTKQRLARLSMGTD